MKNRNYHVEAIIICVLYYMKRLIISLGKFVSMIVIIYALEYGLAKMVALNDNNMREILAMVFVANYVGLFVVAVLILVNILESISTLGELIGAIEALYDRFKFNIWCFESILKGNNKTDSILDAFLYNDLAIYKKK